MNKNLKALFIFPPFWSTGSISTGIPQIMGFLKKHGYYNIQALDLNIKFHNQFYNKEKLLNIFDEIQTNKEKVQKLIFNNDINDNNIICVNNHILKNLEEYLSEENILKRIKLIEQIDKIHKKEGITEEGIKENSQIIVEAEAIIQIYEIMNKYKLLIGYYKAIINNILNKKYDYIGFSINSSLQTFSSLILINMLKLQNYNGHICLGGTNINNLEEKIKTNYNLYKKSFDTAIVGRGEQPTLELFEYLSGNRKIEDVSNILYFDKEKKLRINKVKNEHIQEHTNPIYNGYSFQEYTLPESILPIRSSYGCYWGKCSFCNYSSFSQYRSRTVSDVISEIENNISKYKINNFYFVDAGVSPNFLEEFSSEIIKRNLEIYYFANLRFEKDYDKNLIEKLYKSGLRAIGWGLESASERILKLMKKGIDINTSEKILKEAHKVGIINHIYYIYAFPSETVEDFEKTYNFILKNDKYIDSIAEHRFTFLKGSPIEANKETFFIKSNFSEKNILSQINPKTNILEINMKYYNERINKLESLIKASKFTTLSIDNFLIIGKYRTNQKHLYHSLTPKHISPNF